MNKKGFTLLEILIAVMILAVLSTLTAQEVISSMKNKAKQQKEIDRDSTLINAVRLIERDVHLAFHARDVNQEIEKAIQKTKPQQGQQNPAGQGQQGQGGQTGQTGQTTGATPPPPPPADFKPKDYKNWTQFIGKEDSMYFSSLGHTRVIQDSQESEQEEIGYYVARCDSLGEKKTGQCLFRSTTPYIDDDVTLGGTPSSLIANVTKFSLRYLGEGKQDWVKEWRTDDGGDDVTREHFPQAVELTLTVKDNDKDATLSTVIPIYFPNNIPPPQPTTPAQQGTTPPANQGKVGP